MSDDLEKKQAESLNEEVNSTAIKPVNVYREKAEKVLESLKQLFNPFKEVLVNILPSFKVVIKWLDYFGLFISKLVLLISDVIPYLVSFVKGKTLKIILLLVVVIVIANSIVSRYINKPYVREEIANLIYKDTGYIVYLQGRVRVNLFTLKLTLTNVQVKEDTLNNISAPKSNFLGLTAESLIVHFNVFDFIFKGFALTVDDLKIDKAKVYYGFLHNEGDSPSYSKYQTIKDQINTTLNTDSFKEVIKKADNNLKDEEDKVNAQEENLDGSMFADNQNRYLDLGSIFNQVNTVKVRTKEAPSKYTFKLSNYIAKINFDWQGIDGLSVTNTSVILVDSGKDIFEVNNIYAKLNRSISNKITFEGNGRFLDKNIFYDFVSKNNTFNAVVSFLDDSLKQKDLIIKGNINGNDYNGSLELSKDGFYYMVNSLMYSYDKPKENIALKSNFDFKNALLTVSNIEIKNGKDIYSGNILLDFNKNSVFELNLNIKTDNLNFLVNNFKQLKEDKYSDDSSSEELINIINNWETTHFSYFNPKITSINITAQGTNINKNHIDNIDLSFFIDQGNDFYLNKLSVASGNTKFDLIGAINLANKNGVLGVSSAGSIANLSSLFSSNASLNKLLTAISGNNDGYSLSGKVFLDNSRIIGNDISGNIGDKVINTADVIYLERTDNSDLIISADTNIINLDDLTKIYYFNKGGNDQYFDTGKSFTGITEGTKIQLNISAKELDYESMVLENAQIESSIISSGILVHSFSAEDENGGTVKGSFNFDNKVTPALVGSLNFDNFEVNIADFKNKLFSNYNLAGKVIVSGSLNFSGESYDEGIGNINGNLSLLQLERYKLKKGVNMDGFYLTILDAKDKMGNNYKQLADLYATLKIVNSKIIFDPVFVRYVSGAKNYRGNFSGNLLYDDTGSLKLDIKGQLINEKRQKDIITFDSNNSDLKDLNFSN